jgi:hypothetical protein
MSILFFLRRIKICPFKTRTNGPKITKVTMTLLYINRMHQVDSSQCTRQPLFEPLTWRSTTALPPLNDMWVLCLPLSWSFQSKIIDDSAASSQWQMWALLKLPKIMSWEHREEKNFGTSKAGASLHPRHSAPAAPPLAIALPPSRCNCLFCTSFARTTRILFCSYLFLINFSYR